MSRINTNVSSLVSQLSLGRSNADLQTSLLRLSTGLRINSGKDDPAGLIASENLRRDITSVEKAISNSERANQIIATADSSLGQVSKLLNDIRGLVTEAANTGALSEEQIAANQMQVDSSLEAIDRIAQTTTFQGRTLLDGSLDFLVTAGTGFDSVEKLSIQQAILGATGAVDIDVVVSSAATRAQITNEIPDSATGQFALGDQTFTIESTAAADLDSVTIAVQKNDGPEATGALTINGHEFTFTAASGQTIDNVDVDVAKTSASHRAEGDITLDQTTLTLKADADETLDNVTVSVQKDTMGATADSENVRITDGTNDTVFTIAATSAGYLGINNIDDVAIVVNEADLGTANATLAGKARAIFTSANTTLTITLDNSAATASTADIATAIAAAYLEVDGAAPGTAMFTSSVTSGSGTLDVSGAGAAALDGASDTTLTREEVTAAYSAGTNTLTLTLNSDLTNVTTAQIKAAVNALSQFNGAGSTIDPPLSGPTNIATASVTASATYGTMQRSGVTVTYTDGGGGDPQLNLNFDPLQVAIDINEVIEAVDGLTEFAGTTSTSDSGTINGTAVSAATTDDVMTRLDGTNGGVKARFNTSTNLLTLTFDGSDTTVASSAVISAIDGLTQFENTDSTDPSGNIDATELEETTGLATVGRVQDIVVRVAGEFGGEVFNFQAGATFEQIADAIQLVSDATGVTAEVVGSQLRLTATNYGSDAFVDVEVISEGTGGVFKDNLSATRATGEDIDASVNGVQANGDGNTLSVQTSTLDLSLTVADGSDDSVQFTINGGGATFQLGPDVVSNQQARLAIDNIATGKLGGASGRLYELRSGNARALANDTTGAARIVDEAITTVVELRGRLGAFQRTTVGTNIGSLQDTLVNLTQAESDIRDADFAKESAGLTRAQILVQAGTATLAIANQNPQNVLALLR